MQMHPKQVNKVGSEEFLKLIENLNKKCERGEKLPEKDVNEFCEIISSTQNKTGKKTIGEASVVNDRTLNETITALKQLQVTLDQNKAVLESAARGVPYTQIQSAIDNLVQYVNEQKKNSQKVSRKDSEKPNYEK